jgi:flagellar motor switch/type III secretory pathway protein FliN
MEILTEHHPDARPLHWWSAAQLTELARQIEPVWAAWLRDWAATPTAGMVAVACELAAERKDLAHLHWNVLGATGSECAWHCAVSEESASPIDGSIAKAVWQEAQADFQAAICARLKLESCATTSYLASNFKEWAGAVILSMGDGQCSPVQHVLLAAQPVSQMLAGFAPRRSEENTRLQRALVPVEAALNDKPVRISAQLAPCEIDLGSLLGLRVGDIVPLPHPLEEPLAVHLESHPFCRAYLGKQGGAKAIELVRN